MMAFLWYLKKKGTNQLKKINCCFLLQGVRNYLQLFSIKDCDRNMFWNGYLIKLQKKTLKNILIKIPIKMLLFNTRQVR